MLCKSLNSSIKCNKSLAESLSQEIFFVVNYLQFSSPNLILTIVSLFSVLFIFSISGKYFLDYFLIILHYEFLVFRMYQRRKSPFFGGDLKYSTNGYQNVQICPCLQLKKGTLDLSFSVLLTCEINKVTDLIRSKNTDEIVLKVIIVTIFDYSFHFQIRYTNIGHI